MASKRDDLIEFAHICGQENIPRNLVAKDRENASDDLLRHTRERLVMLPDCAWESLGITPTQAKIVRAAFDVAATVRKYDEGDRCSFRCDLHRYAEFLECIKKGAQ